MSFPNIVTLKTKLLLLSFMRTYMQTVAALYAEKQAAEATAGKWKACWFRIPFPTKFSISLFLEYSY